MKKKSTIFWYQSIQLKNPIIQIFVPHHSIPDVTIQNKAKQKQTKLLELRSICYSQCCRVFSMKWKVSYYYNILILSFSRTAIATQTSVTKELNMFLKHNIKLPKGTPIYPNYHQKLLICNRLKNFQKVAILPWKQAAQGYILYECLWINVVFHDIRKYITNIGQKWFVFLFHVRVLETVLSAASFSQQSFCSFSQLYLRIFSWRIIFHHFFPSSSQRVWSVVARRKSLEKTRRKCTKKGAVAECLVQLSIQYGAQKQQLCTYEQGVSRLLLNRSVLLRLFTESFLFLLRRQRTSIANEFSKHSENLNHVPYESYKSAETRYIWTLTSVETEICWDLSLDSVLFFLYPSVLNSMLLTGNETVKRGCSLLLFQLRCAC